MSRLSGAPAVNNHGGHFFEFNIPCEADPSSWCNMHTGELSPDPDQYKYVHTRSKFPYIIIYNLVPIPQAGSRFPPKIHSVCSLIAYAISFGRPENLAHVFLSPANNNYPFSYFRQTPFCFVWGRGGGGGGVLRGSHILRKNKTHQFARERVGGRV